MCHDKIADGLGQFVVADLVGVDVQLGEDQLVHGALEAGADALVVLLGAA
jgi:hypothetical protein